MPEETKTTAKKCRECGTELVDIGGDCYRCPKCGTKQ